MNLTLALAALLLVAPAAASAQVAPEWQRFEPEDKSFSVLLPFKPSAASHTDPGDPRMKMTFYRGQSGGLHFSVSSFDSTKVLLLTAGNFDAFVASMNATYCEAPRQSGLECALTFVRELKLKEFPGKQYKVSVRGKGQSFAGVMRVYLVGSHVYTLHIIGAYEDDAAADKFFNSFAPAAK